MLALSLLLVGRSVLAERDTAGAGGESASQRPASGARWPAGRRFMVSVALLKVAGFVVDLRAR